MISCADLIQNYIAYSTSEFRCDRKGDYFVIRTPFSYFDGDEMQIFVRELGEQSIEISDLGHTVAKLNSAGIEIGRARSRENLVESIQRSRGVDIDHGRIFTVCNQASFPESLVSLMQAMQQVDDIAFSKRAPVFHSFVSEIENVLHAANVGFKRGARLVGASGKVHEFDFQIELPILTVVKGLSAVSSLGADDQANRLVGAILNLRPVHPRLEPIIFLDAATEVKWDYAQQILTQVAGHVFRMPVDEELSIRRLASLQRTG